MTEPSADTPDPSTNPAGDDALPLHIQRDIERKMKLLVGELENIASATEGDKDFQSMPLIKGGPFRSMQRAVYYASRSANDESIQASKKINREIYRAAGALLDVYYQLGAIPLALAVAAIRKSVENGSPPEFERETADIMSQWYRKLNFTPNATPEVPAEKPKGSRRHFLIGGGVAAIAGILKYRSMKDKSDHTTSRIILENRAVDLESEPVLTKEQKKELIRLQKIEIPREIEAEKNAQWWSDSANYGIGGGALFALLGLLEVPSIGNFMNRKQGQPKTITHVMTVMDSVLADACANHNPPITSFHVPGR